MIAIAVIDAVDVVGVIDVAVVAIDVVDIVVGLFSVRGSGPGCAGAGSPCPQALYSYKTNVIQM